jgi:Bacterial toxin 44
MSDPYIGAQQETDQPYPRFGEPVNQFGGCSVDGVPTTCSYAAGLLNSGSASLCPGGDCGPHRVTAHDAHGNITHTWRPLTATVANGMGYFYSTYVQANVMLDPAHQGESNQIGVVDNRSGEGQWERSHGFIYAGEVSSGLEGMLRFVGYSARSQHTDMHDKGNNDPCNIPLGPLGVDINKNISAAEQHPVSGTALINPGIAYSNAKWFRDMVRNAKGRIDDVRSGKSWDYKQIGYADFGNFNYGATGAAAGFSETRLLREAGRAQIEAGTSRPGWGEPGNLYNPLGGTPPYGDDPDDQVMIKRGVAYYEAGCNKR